MTRSRWHPGQCKVCGKTRQEAGHISATGLCPEHSRARFEENFDAMKEMRGPFAHWWAVKLAASVGYAPLDETVSRP